MARRANLKASDADREKVAERLRQATGEGRLHADELEQRLEAAFSARTYGELDAVIADLPGPHSTTVRRRPRELAWLPPALALAVAIPVALAVIAAVVLALTGALAVWWVWIVAGWWFFGHHRRRYYGGRYGGSLHACGAWHRSRVRAGASRGYWL